MLMPYADVVQVLDQAAESADVSRHLVRALAWVESRWNPEAVSSAGARGLLQLMPAPRGPAVQDPDDVEENARVGARYLRRLLERFNGSEHRALAAYNRGAGWVRKNPNTAMWPSKLRAYIAAIQAAKLRGISAEQYARERGPRRAQPEEVATVAAARKARVDPGGAGPLSCSRWGSSSPQADPDAS